MNQEAAPNGTPESGPSEEHAQRRKGPVFAIIAVVLLVAGTLIVFWVNRSPKESFPIPDVDLKGVDYAVVQVIKKAQQDVREDLHDADSWGHLGKVLYGHQKNAPAVECFAIAEKLDLKNHRWPYLRGMILAEDSTANGLPHVRRAVDLVPENTSLRLRLAEFLFDVRELEESESIFRDVLKSDSENARAKLGLARVLSVKKNGDPQEALRWAAGAARTLPGTRATHELLAKLLYRTGKKEAAQKQLEFVDRLPKSNLMWPDPILADVVLLRVDKRWLQEKAHRYMMMGQSDRYIQTLQRLVAEQPEDAFMHAVLGRTMLKLKNLKAARAVLENAVRRHPDSLEVVYLWGIMHYEEGKYQEAEQIFRKVTGKKPDYPEAWNALAQSQRQIGDDEKAIASYRQVLKYEPFFPKAHVGLAELLYKYGDQNAARDHLKTALELAPDDPDTLRALKKMRS